MCFTPQVLNVLDSMRADQAGLVFVCSDHLHYSIVKVLGSVAQSSRLEHGEQLLSQFLGYLIAVCGNLLIAPQTGLSIYSVIVNVTDHPNDTPTVKP
jgi:hypothetical protein